jgi:hypothetical protein
MKKENILVLIGASIGASIGITAYTIYKLNKASIIEDKKNEVKEELLNDEKDLKKIHYDF